MMFRTAIFALLSTLAFAEEPMLDVNGSISVASNAGQELLMKATVVEEARILNNNNDYAWMSSYSIKYTGCTSLVQVSGQGGNNNKNNGEGMLFTQHLVRFSLCPATDCASSCTGGGHYIVSMQDFVDLYTEAKLEEQEYQCEMIRESCYCENANDDQVCENQCYTNAGMDVCIDYEGDEDFEVQRYLECAEMKNQNGNNNNNNNYNYGGDYYYGQYYIGPYCPDGKSIMLGLFYDQGCSAMADVTQYASRMGGATLPYSTTSMVIENDCLACAIENINGNGEVEYEMAEICKNIYAEAAKCEESMENGPQYPETQACDYIDNILPRLYAASQSLGVGSVTYVKKGRAAKAFAFIFAFTTVLFGAYAYFLYRKIKRGVVALAAQGN